MKIIFEKTCPEAQLPKQATERDFGFDVKSIEDYTLQPNEAKAIDTGLLWEPVLNWFEKRKYVYSLEVRPRSGLAIKNYISVLNSPGTIDEEYTNHIKIILINHGKLPFVIKKGDRIAQIFPQRRPICKMREGVINKNNDRGGGFGSSGIK